MDPIAPPSLLVEMLWGPPMRGSIQRFGNGGVGLFGAIEVAHHNGPVLQDRIYAISARVVAVAESPIATQRMMLRFMKDSSPLYR